MLSWNIRVNNHGYGFQVTGSFSFTIAFHCCKYWKEHIYHIPGQCLLGYHYKERIDNLQSLTSYLSTICDDHVCGKTRMDTMVSWLICSKMKYTHAVVSGLQVLSPSQQIIPYARSCSQVLLLVSFDKNILSPPYYLFGMSPKRDFPILFLGLCNVVLPLQTYEVWMWIIVLLYFVSGSLLKDISLYKL